MPDGLILRIRTETLWASLEKVKKILDKAPDRRKALGTLGARFDTVTAALYSATSSLGQVRAALLFKDTSQATSGYVDVIDKCLKQILDEVNAGIEDVKTMQKKGFRIQETDFWTPVEESLGKRTEKPMQWLTELQTRLDDPATKLEEEWPKFLLRARCVSETIFAEYIEFLEGLALRDTEYDMRISQLAEELVRKYNIGGNVAGMLAIPARQQAMAMTLARIIRVTFPDWSIWSLPSTAYEFWRVVAQRDLAGPLRTALRQCAKNPKDTIEPRFQECLGDAFATYMLGPAYAYSCVCLQLDPTSAYTSARPVPESNGPEWDCGDDPPPAPSGGAQAKANPATYPGDGVRVKCILRMLELMDQKASSQFASAYLSVRQTLANAWDDAVKQSSAAPTQAHLAAYQADVNRGTLLVEALWNTPAIATSAAFTVQVWNDVQSWVKPLLSGKPGEIQLPAAAEMRHVLNAVWLARVDPSWKSELTGAVDKLAEAANTLAERISTGVRN
jgi:hypothetical protein